MSSKEPISNDPIASVAKGVSDSILNKAGNKVKN